MPVLMELFAHLFETLAASSKINDLRRIVFQSSQLENPVSLKLARRDEINAEMFLHEVSKVLQSYNEFSLPHPIFINVLKLPAPQSGSRTGKLVREVNFKTLLRGQRLVITVKNNDDMCFARCLVVGMALANGVAHRRNETRWRINLC